ncbi:fungal-specific transcription factor domain-containing protein [Phellopilus nigrolimitatus]|nr:fungal-specific transcription factor domain-containing protein [Phellopilus nigrolimitatus]
MGANEKESTKVSGSKNDRKLGMSCAECRRSKLKCDRSFPCSACVRRGCANICPDGTLAATKGNKVLQTQNETLMQTVKRMTTRIHDLEAALGNTQAQISPQPHPLLQDNERLKETAIRVGDEYEGSNEDIEEASDLVGSLAIGEQGRTRFHGQSSASEFLQTLLPGSEEDGLPPFSSNLYKMGLPLHIIDLVNAFPFGAVTPDPEARSSLLRFLPDHSKALALSLLYFEHAGCSFQVVQQEIFIPFLLRILMQVANGMTIGENLHSHEVAVIFLVFAVGSHVSEDSNDQALGEKYRWLACAAMSLNPLMKEATSTTLQALFVMVQYFSCVDSPSCERRWLLSGVMYRLAYSVKRDPALWKLSTEETQRRRTLFWEMYAWDAWNSITYGRPPSLNINYTDCRFPEDRSAVSNAKGEKEMSYESYKHRFAAFILAPVLDHVFGVRQLNYAALLDIDIKLRKLPPPSWLLAPTRGKGEPVDGRAWNANSTQAMQQYCVVCARESTLLYIHRRYFATAIRLNSANPLKTKYGASVMAACRSACLLLSGLRSLYGAHPKPASKQSFFWSGAFSACIVLSCLVYNSPGCSVANDALRAIDDGVELYSMRVFEDNSSSVKLLSSVRDNVHKMFEKHHGASNIQLDTEHGADCATMRVLEGNTVLINLNDVKFKTPTVSTSGSDISSPASQSDSQQDDVSQREPRVHTEDAYGNGLADAVHGPVSDYRLLAFSGLHSAPEVILETQPPEFAAPPSVYKSLDPMADKYPTAPPASGSQKHRNIAVLGSADPSMNYAMFDDFGSTESLPTMGHGAIPPYAPSCMEYAPAMDTSGSEGSFVGPTGMGQNIYSGTPWEGVYDQASWERFLGEMGIPNPGS